MSPTLGWLISRLVSTRWPIFSVGIIEPLGIRYGLTTNAWISSASPTATATVTTSSTQRLHHRAGPRLAGAMAIRAIRSGRAAKWVKNAVPMIQASGTGPQKRLSWESGRLSPMRNRSPRGSGRRRSRAGIGADRLILGRVEHRWGSCTG